MTWKEKLQAVQQQEEREPFVNTDPQLQVDTGMQEALNILRSIPEHTAAASLNILQAPTLGWADEIMSSFPLTRPSEEFRAQHREAYPMAGVLAEAGGGLGTAGASVPGLLSRTAQIGNPIARNLANLGLAGSAGGTYGLGIGEGSLSERLPGAAGEAALSMAAGPVGYMAGRVASALGDPILELGGRLFRGPEMQASTMIGRERARGNVPTTEDFDRRTREELTPNVPGRDDIGDLITNADIDPAAAQQLKEIYDKNPSSQGQIEQFLGQRQRDASRRTIDDISDITGINRSSNKALEEFAEQANRKANAEGYREIYQSRVSSDGPVGEMFLGPEGRDLKRAYVKAGEIAAREGDPIPPYDQVFGEDGTLESLPLKAVDYMQRFFRKAGKPNMDPEWDHLSWRRLRERFLSAVDEEVPRFKEVRANYANQMALEDAMNEGRNVYKLGDARDIEDYLNTLSGPEQLSFRRGAIEAVESRLRNARVASGNVNTFMQGTANQEDILRLVFGDNYDDVAKVLERENAFSRTFQRVLGGSSTSRNIRGGDTFGGLDIRGETPSERLYSAATDLGGRALGSAPHPTTIEAMVDQLLASGYTREQAERIARAGMAEEMATQFGRATGGAGVLAPGALSDWWNRE